MRTSAQAATRHETSASYRGARGGSNVAAWAISLLLVSLVGCIPLSEAGKSHLNQALQQYRNGHFAEAENAASQAINVDAASPAIAEAYYVRGCARMHQGEQQQAKQDFREALAKSKRADLTVRAKAALGAIAVDDREYAQACTLLSGSVEKLPARPPTDEILLRYGIALQRTGHWREARQVLGQVVSKYRGRPVEEKARELFSWPADYFAIQCGVFSRRSNAEKLRQKLHAAGWPAEVRTDVRQRRGVYYVWVGHFETYAEANAKLPQVKRTQADAFVVP